MALLPRGSLCMHLHSRSSPSLLSQICTYKAYMGECSGDPCCRGVAHPCHTLQRTGVYGSCPCIICILGLRSPYTATTTVPRQSHTLVLPSVDRGVSPSERYPHRNADRPLQPTSDLGGENHHHPPGRPLLQYRHARFL